MLSILRIISKSQLLLLMVFAPIAAIGQIFVTGDQKGVDCRDVLVADIIVHSFAEDTIECWLDNEAFMTVTVSTDTLGHLRNILKVRSRKIQISQSEISRWQKCWKDLEIRIPTTYCEQSLDPLKTVYVAIEEIRKDARNGCDSITQTIGFPPECIYAKVYSQTDSCSRLEQLKKEIKAFLVNRKDISNNDLLIELDKACLLDSLKEQELKTGVTSIDATKGRNP